MNVTADAIAVSRAGEGLNRRWVTSCAVLALTVSLVLGNGAGRHGITAPLVVPLPGVSQSSEASRFPPPPAFNQGQPAIPGPLDLEDGEDTTGVRDLESRLIPLRGAPAWVWDLADDDPRKAAAIDDWAVVAASDREASMVVMEWAGKIMPDSEFWNGLCPRWLADPEWGGVGQAQ